MTVHSIASSIFLADLEHLISKPSLIPLDSNLNFDVAPNEKGKLNTERLLSEKGIVMFHGAAHGVPDIPKFLCHIPFETADIEAAVRPTHVIDFFKQDQLQALGFYKYSLDYYGPTGANPSFLNYLYRMRQITLPAGLIMFRYGFMGMRSVRWTFRTSLDLSISKMLDCYMEYLRQLVIHCGCRSFQWYNLRSHRYFTSVHDTGYTIDIYGDPVPDRNLILIVHV